MVDLCHQNHLNCSNGGQCAVNITLNTTYCQCNPCNDGSLCENNLAKQLQLKTDYIYLIIFIIGLFLSVLNNILSLEVFLGCSRVRRTNCGIYLIVYSIVSILSSIILLVYQVLTYYGDQVGNTLSDSLDYNCYFGKIGYNTLVYICIWLSSLVAFERGLIVCFNSKTNATRWRSFGFLIFIFLVAAGSALPMIAYKCDWNNQPHLQVMRIFFVWFYIIIGVGIYLLATLLILISFALHIRRHGTENGSFIKTFLKLFYTHLFIFIPPVAYGLGYILYTIVLQTGNPDVRYFHCGMSSAELIIKVIIESLQGIPFVITWLLFIYPSNVHMNEYYMNTWSGKRLAKIVIFFKRNNNRKNSPHTTTNDLTDNENDNGALHCENS